MTTLPRRTAKAFKISELREGQVAYVDFTVSNKEMDIFAKLSGDQNPLHGEDDIARERGFEGRVVYGALIIAQLSRLIGMELPGRDSVWSGLQIQFLEPLYIGEAARLEALLGHLSLSTQSIELRFEVRAATRLIARGKAAVVIQNVA